MKIIITLTDDGLIPHYDIRIESNNPTVIYDAIDIIKNIKGKMKELCME